MNKVYFCSIAFLFFSKANSQIDTFTIGKNQIHFSPLRMVDIMNPGIEMGYERLFKKHYSTKVSAAYMCNPFKISDFYRVCGYRLAMEEKYFFRMKNTHKTYLSAEAVYNHLHLGYPYIDDSSDSIYVHKYTTTLNFKYGWQTYFNKHLMIDVGFGLGIKYFNTHLVYYEVKNTVDNVAGTELFNWYEKSSHPGHYFTVNIPFTIKIGYSF